MALRSMPTAEARYKFLRGMSKAGAQQRWHWYARTAYLSGMATQWRNLSGNASNFGLEATIIPNVAAGFDAIRNPGNRQVTLTENTAIAAGLSSGFLDGIQKASFFFKNGFTMDNATALDDVPPEVFGGALFPNAIGRAMGSVDQFFRTVGLQMEVHRVATTQAVREGLTGPELARRVQELVDDPTITPELHKRAQRYAAELTFQEQQTSKSAAKVVGGIKQFMGGLDGLTEDMAEVAWEAGLKKLGTMGSLTYGALSYPPSAILAPFINTPFNIFKRFMSYTPPAMLAATKGNDRDAMLMAARGAVGTAMMGAGAGLYMSGRLTGAAPQDVESRDAFYAEGKQPYAIKVGEQWVPIQYLGPVGMLLGATANYAQAAEANPRNTLNLFGDLMSQTGKMLVDQTMLRGLYGAMDAVANPNGTAGEKWLARTVTSQLPVAAAQRDVRDLVDPVLRNPEGLREQVMASVPGLSDNVTPRINFTGDEIPRSNKILPTASSPDPVRQELLRLRMATPGKDGYFRDPVGAGKALLGKINTQRKRAKLPQLASVPRRLVTDYAQAHGQEAQRLLSGVVSTRAYQALDDTERAAIVEAFKQQITERTDQQFVERYMREGAVSP
jgi:hypothetical protein